MLIDKSKKILIVGLGLLGGSYAIRFSKYGFDVKAFCKSERTAAYAVKNRIVSAAYTDVVPEVISASDIIIFGLYPKVFIEWVKEYGKYIKPGTFVTDVTGVKSPVVYEIEKNLPEGVDFVPSHPMCGREVSGVENATDTIFAGANFIITPTDKTSFEAVNTCKNLAEILGFEKISCLTPEEHDNMIAFLSQLTHCIAVTLMTCNDCSDMEKYTGDSFRDLTRIARINENMWTELFLMNKKDLVRNMKDFRNSFDILLEAVENEDSEKIKEIMRKSTERRKMFDRK